MTLFRTLIPTITRTPTAATATNSAATNAAPAPALTPSIKPRYEIKESPEAWGVTVQLPGVAKDGIELTADEGVLTIVGRRAWTPPAGWTALYRESSDTRYELTLTHDNTIDADKIAAELRDGVLRLSLPKAEAVKPRKIAVN